MSGCEHVRPALGGYVLGGLEPAEASAVREHLTTCARCAAEHARLAGLPELLSLAEGLDDAHPPEAVEERLLDAVARERGDRRPARRARPRAHLPWIAGAAAVAAAAVAALVVALSAGDPAPRRYELQLRPVGVSTGSARVELEAVPGGTAVHLWVRDLPADPNAVYEVRCDAPGWSASAGTFRTDTHGRAHVVLTTAARRGEYESIRIVRRERGRTVAVMAAPLS